MNYRVKISIRLAELSKVTNAKAKIADLLKNPQSRTLFQDIADEFYDMLAHREGYDKSQTSTEAIRANPDLKKSFVEFHKAIDVLAKRGEFYVSPIAGSRNDWGYWRGLGESDESQDTYKMYITIPNPINNIDFIRRLPALAGHLYIATDELDPDDNTYVSFKFPENFKLFLKHNDNIVIYYQDPRMKDIIQRVSSDWLRSNKIETQERELGRSEWGRDPAAVGKRDSMSWTQDMSQKAARWLLKQFRANPTDVNNIIDQAVLKAIDISKTL
jgi:hypothetical protein